MVLPVDGATVPGVVWFMESGIVLCMEPGIVPGVAGVMVPGVPGLVLRCGVIPGERIPGL